MRTRMLFFIIIVVLCVSHTGFFAFAEPVALPALKVATGDDESIVLQRVLFEALQRSGHQMVLKTTGMRTAIADTHNGDAAILLAQSEGWEQQYENLIPVPVVIDHIEFTAYTRAENTSQFSQWSDLAGLRLGHRWQNIYIAQNISRAGADEITVVNTIDELWAALLNGEADAVILPRNAHDEFRFPQGIRRAGVLERQACYTYVNNQYAYLVPLLAQAYTQMYADGTMELIRNNQKLSGDEQIILHINSYSAQMEAEQRQIESIRRNFEQSVAPDYRVIDLNAHEMHSQASYGAIVSDWIRTEFIIHPPDLVLVSGDEALEFVLENYYYLFQKVPIVFFGVLGVDVSILYGLEEHFTGISESVSFAETVSEMLRLYPDTRRIFILNDHRLAKSVKYRETIQAAIDADPVVGSLPVAFEWSEDKSFDEILDTIRGLSADTLVLIGSYVSDGGTILSESDVQRRVADASAKPVFCLTAPFIGSGTLGGMVSGTDLQGAAIASMAVAILNGVTPADIPIMLDSASLNQWQFDYDTAKRFGVNVNAFPAGHLIINRLLPIWESNPIEFHLAVAVAGLLLLIIGGLMVFSKALAKKQAAAEAASVVKTAFLSNMSHEMRTPMNAIIGMTSIGKSAPDIERKDYAFGKIEDASTHLLGVINDVLDISKIEANMLELSPVEFDFERMIQKVVSVINFRMNEKQLAFTVNIGENVPRFIVGDDQRLAQVIMNLLSNAVKFTPELGTIHLDVTMTGEADGLCELCVSVTDTGIGISHEQQAKLFQAFSQGDNRISRMYGGTGLGLVISKRIVEMMDGRLWVESELGKGARFIFTLKAAYGEKSSGIDGVNDCLGTEDDCREENDASGEFAGKRLLLAEDFEINREIVLALLEDTGLEIDCAENGREALSMVEAAPEKYDLVFMDVQMPKMDGLEATRRIRALPAAACSEIPIVAMTADVFKDDIERCLAAGMNGHIGKPLDVNDMYKELRRYLVRR